MTYKQQLINLLTDEIKHQREERRKLYSVCSNCVEACGTCKDHTIYREKVTRLQGYIKKVNALPARVFISHVRFRHEVVNSINLFMPKLIDKLYES
jgi:hypothetical protein